MTMQTTTVNIDGMTCGGCVKSISNALAQVAGVAKSDISLEQHHATIHYDDSQTTITALQQAIEEAGFEVV